MTATRKIVLFDGVCNLCNSSVQFLLKRDKKGVFKYASLQSEIGNDLASKYGVAASKLESMVFIDGGKAYTESDAVLNMTKYLGFPWNMAYGFIIIPKFIRNPIYKWIAKNRYKWFGKQESCMLPSEDISDRFLETV